MPEISIRDDRRAALLFQHERSFAEHIGKSVCVVQKDGRKWEGRFAGRSVPPYLNSSVVVYVDIGDRVVGFADYEVETVEGFYY